MAASGPIAAVTQTSVEKRMLASHWSPQSAKLLMTIFLGTSAIATAFYSRAESVEPISMLVKARFASASRAHKTRAKGTEKHCTRELSTNRQFSGTRSIRDYPHEFGSASIAP